MATPSSDNVVLGRGAVYFDRLTSAGVRTGFRHLGNCDAFGIGIETEKLTMRDYTQQTSANYKEVIVGTDVNLTLSGFEFDPQNLALATLGESSVLTQTAATVTDETLAAATVTGLKGKYFQTSKRNISTVNITQGATVLVNGTDYEVVNADTGLIRILPTGSTVADGTALLIDYAAAAITSADDINQIKGAVVAAVEGVLLFRANNTTGGNKEVKVFRASLTPNGELGLISDEFGKWTLEGKALSDAAGAYGGSASSPYFQIIGDL